jgi:hypothetical protein
MELLGITKIQEPNEYQYWIVIPSVLKKIMKQSGMTKGTRIAIYKRENGYFITSEGVTQE